MYLYGYVFHNVANTNPSGVCVNTRNINMIVALLLSTYAAYSIKTVNITAHIKFAIQISFI